ncbi:MAG: N-6 DNA methylase [Acidobacteriia bacterium]|nr:N-6 DNA methylase [Terriglobia bacterium]
MLHIAIKPADKLIKGYYDVLGGLGQLHFDHEGAVRTAFHDVLAGYGKKLHWTLVDEYPMKGRQGRIAIDGALLDEWKQRHGFWEAKDIHDQLEREIRKKIEQGYPTTNTIFQMPERAILYQKGVPIGLNEDIRDAKNLVELLRNFFEYREPDHEEWDAAVAEFKLRIPELAERAKQLIDAEHKSNRAFRDSFEAFYALCRQAINPNLTRDAVEKMLIQHLLTERIFRRVFHAEEFRSRNVIAAEIEKVITSMTSRQFSRDQFLSDLDRFYKAIERAAEDKDDYSEKQAFLNTVYERFFQGYSPKEADTHGIVYTPQPIVDFMVRSVEDILKKEFGRSLADRNVHILDPFVGTGNFITRVMRQIAETDKGALPYKYENELHCNEVMLLPYYIASMNIEHEYLAQTGEYKPFDGICLVDTFELAEPEQGGLEFMTEENTERVKRQKQAPIFVIIGNPPYNMGQVNENDENKNRSYPTLDARVADTYTARSLATLRNKLLDPYVKAFRWASDRVREEGVVCFVSNNSFLDNVAFDGMRACLETDFDAVYHLNLKGNAHTSGTRRKAEAGNIFDDQIRVGVGITVLVRKSPHTRPATIQVYSVDDFWTSEQKRDLLIAQRSFTRIALQPVAPDEHHNWINKGVDEFKALIPFAGKTAKHGGSLDSVFSLYSLGVATNRDVYAFNFQFEQLASAVSGMLQAYEEAVAIKTLDPQRPVEALVDTNDKRIKWTRQTKAALGNLKQTAIRRECFRNALYRPFTSCFLYFDDFWNEEQYRIPTIFPTPQSETENVAIVASVIGFRAPFTTFATSRIPELHFGCSTDGFQCFPFYTYSEDGPNRRENITDWALEQFRSHYHDPSISKWDIFHYIYAVLHHPEYRSRYAANLKRELPRIPFLAAAAAPADASLKGHDFSRAEKTAPTPPASAAEGTSSSASVPSVVNVFRSFVAAGQRLADIHVHYEQQPEYPLEKLWKPTAKLDYRVTKMRLSNKDKSTLFYNDALTLKGIPLETYDYRLGNRSALEWIIDQYQVSTDKRSGITNDPNRPDDREYILRLIGQVITVSLETVQIVKSLPEFILADKAGAVSSGS